MGCLLSILLILQYDADNKINKNNMRKTASKQWLWNSAIYHLKQI